VHAAEAYRKAIDRAALLAHLKREGVDTSFAEGLPEPMDVPEVRRRVRAAIGRRVATPQRDAARRRCGACVRSS
jgi:hypothetical protein